MVTKTGGLIESGFAASVPPKPVDAILIYSESSMFQALGICANRTFFPNCKNLPLNSKNQRTSLTGLKCSTLFQQQSLPYQAPSLNNAARPSLLIQPFVLRQPCDAKLSNPTVQLRRNFIRREYPAGAKPSGFTLGKLKEDSSRDLSVPGWESRFIKLSIRCSTLN